MTSDKGKVATRQTGVSSLLEQNLHTSGKFCVQCRIKFQLQSSSIFIGWKYLGKISAQPHTINYAYSLCPKETIGITMVRRWDYFALFLLVFIFSF